MADASILRLRVDSQEYDNKIGRAAEGLSRLWDAFRKGKSTLGSSQADLLKYVQSLGTMETKSTTLRGKISELSKAYIELGARYNQMSDEMKKSDIGKAAGDSLDQLAQRVVNAKKQLNELGDAIGNVRRGSSKVGGLGIENVVSGLNGINSLISGGMGGLTSMIGKAGPYGAAAAGVLTLGSAFVDLGKDAIEARKTLENLELNIGTLLGSAEKGKALVKELQQYGVATPYDTEGLAGAARTMLAYGVSAEQIMPLMRELGDVAQGNTQNLNSLALAFGQMTAVGTVQKQDLNQMANAGFGFNQIAKSMGITVEEFLDMVSKKKVSVDDIAKALHTATSEGGLFYNSAVNASKGLEGTFSNFEESLTNTKAQFGALLEPAVVEIVNSLGEAIEGVTKEFGSSAEAAESFRTVGEGIGFAIKTVVNVGGALVNIITSITSAIGKLLDLAGIDILDGVGAAIKALLAPINGVANLINETYDLITGKGATATKAVKELTEAQKQQQAIAKKTSEGMETVSNAVTKVTSKYETLKKQWGSMRTSNEQTAWIKKNQSEFNALGMTINSTADAMKYFVSNSKNVIAAIKAMAKAQAAKGLYQDALTKELQAQAQPYSVANGGLMRHHSVGERLQPGDYDRYGLTDADFYNKPGEVGQFLNESGYAKAKAYEQRQATARRNDFLDPYRKQREYWEDYFEKSEAEAQSLASAGNINLEGGLSNYSGKKGSGTRKETAADRAAEAQSYYSSVASEVSKFAVQAQQTIAANETAAMADSSDKRKKAIEDNRQKELAALDKQIDDLAKKEAEADQKAWLKQHPKQGIADYRKTANGQQNINTEDGLAYWRNIVMQMQTADGTLASIYEKSKKAINVKFDFQMGQLDETQLNQLDMTANTQKYVQLMTEREKYASKANKTINDYAVIVAIDMQTKALADQNGKLQDRNALIAKWKQDAQGTRDLSVFNSEDIAAKINELQQKINAQDIGTKAGADIRRGLEDQLRDTQNFSTLLQEAIKAGLDPSQFADTYKELLTGEDMNAAIDAMAQKIKDELKEKGIDFKFDKKTGSATSSKDYKYSGEEGLRKIIKPMQDITGMVGNITGGLEQMGIKIPAGITNAVNILQGITGILVGIEAAIHIGNALGIFHNGGIVPHAANGFSGFVPGTRYSGDTTPILANAGEVVLNRAQTASLASQLDDQQQQAALSQPYISGEQIFLGLTAYARRSGRGEIVFSR